MKYNILCCNMWNAQVAFVSDSLISFITSARILAGCYWFSILIWVSTYTANLAAFLTVKNTEQPINNLEELAMSSYQVGVVESAAVYEMFKTSQYEIHKKIWHRMHTEKTFAQSLSQGAQWVRERDQFAFIHDGNTLRYLSNLPPCDLTTGNWRGLGRLKPRGNGIAFFSSCPNVSLGCFRQFMFLLLQNFMQCCSVFFHFDDSRRQTNSVSSQVSYKVSKL